MKRSAAPPSLAEAEEHCLAGRLDEAEQACSAALAATPDHAGARELLGVIRCRRGDFAAGLAHFDAALAAAGASHELLANRGNALASLGRHAEALDSYDRAMVLRAPGPQLLNSRGMTLLALRRGAEALESFEAALRLRPGNAGLLGNRAGALAALGSYEQALAGYGDALRANPGDVGAKNNRGRVLRALYRFDEALADYDAALALRPDHVESHINRGNTLHEMQRLDEAVASYDRALAVDPDCADAHVNRAMTLLAQGDLETGWREYEWRWKLGGFRGYPRFGAPRWDGTQELRGRTIVLHGEQGMGDALQFCRYADAVHRRGAEVVLQVDRGLARLMRTLPGVAKVVAFGEPLPRHDFHCPLLSLPLAFGTTLGGVPAPIPYLHAEADKVAQWRRRLPQGGGRRIGLAWSGNPEQGRDRHRSIPLAALEPLFALPAQWVSLQKELRAADAAAATRQPRLAHFGAELADFSDTAALAQCCDLVIAVNSSVAHLAGALGRPLWVLLSSIPDWRFVQGRDDWAWYPAARLFRQAQLGAWDEVIARLVAALRG
ncbi:MAG TPA: tetratricopeptide repeat protein [Burkholderiales bacterium]|nr:tetratricopeptide repeat protein [Burkholderiales bacterium]